MIFRLLASSIVALSLLPNLAFAQVPCTVRMDIDADKFTVQTRKDESCAAGSPLAFPFWRAIPYLEEQLCDWSKPMRRNLEPGADPALTRAQCVFTGKVAEPDRLWNGLRIELK